MKQTTLKRVVDIMTQDVVVLNEEENLAKIKREMEKFKFRHLPVVDNGELVGLVSHRDLLRASVSSLTPLPGRAPQRVEETFVSSVMTIDVTTAHPDTSLEDAAKMLLDGHFGCLPVINEDRQLVGIVTENDFLKLTLELLRSLRS